MLEDQTRKLNYNCSLNIVTDNVLRDHPHFRFVHLRKKLIKFQFDKLSAASTASIKTRLIFY